MTIEEIVKDVIERNREMIGVLSINPTQLTADTITLLRNNIVTINLLAESLDEFKARIDKIDTLVQKL